MVQNEIIITLGIAVLTIITSLFLSKLEARHQIKMWEMKKQEKYTEKIIDRLLDAYEDLISDTFNCLDKFDDCIIAYFANRGIHTPEEIVVKTLKLSPPPKDLTNEEKEIWMKNIKEFIPLGLTLRKKLNKYSYLISQQLMNNVLELSNFLNPVLFEQKEYSISKSAEIRENIIHTINDELKIKELKSEFSRKK